MPEMLSYMNTQHYALLFISIFRNICFLFIVYVALSTVFMFMLIQSSCSAEHFALENQQMKVIKWLSFVGLKKPFLTGFLRFFLESSESFCGCGFYKEFWTSFGTCLLRLTLRLWLVLIEFRLLSKWKDILVEY
ncbi:hypothetical protein ACKWTF_009392 [Chironomus riparius]